MNTKLRRAIRASILCAFGVGSLVNLAYAQDQDDDDRLEEVVVTGTRINSGNLVSSVPISTVDADYISLSGETNLTNLLRETPALISSDPGDLTGDEGDSDGTAALNLRNLGASRTLVLVNGRRHVSSRTGEAVVDINSIPSALVERVDTLTGGASAIYGADGVSGVVNFILKDDFEGLHVDLSSNTPDESGGDNYKLGVTLDKNLADDRGNVALSVEYFDQNKLLNTQRGLIPGLPESISINPDDDTGVDDPNLPDRIIIANQALPLPFDTRPRIRQDLSFGYRINGNLEVSGGINNLNKPPREIGFSREDRTYFIGVTYSNNGFWK